MSAASDTRRSVVLLSGGLDSATTLALAAARGLLCHALCFDYGQRHAAELRAAERVAQHLHTPLKVLRIDLTQIGGSALTDPSIAVPVQPTTGIPVTYVPARNTIFLSLALGYAETLGATAIHIGVNAVDYSGYPDCRPEFIEAFAALARLATRAGVSGNPTRIEAPLLSMSKAEIIRKGVELGVDYSLTVSCYLADEDGRACGVCDSCRFRKEGFQSAGVADPTRYKRSAG